MVILRSLHQWQATGSAVSSGWGSTCSPSHLVEWNKQGQSYFMVLVGCYVFHGLLWFCMGFMVFYGFKIFLMVFKVLYVFIGFNGF